VYAFVSGEVRSYGGRAAARGLDVSYNLVGPRCLLAVVDDDGGTLAGEDLGNFRADSTG